MQKKTFYSHSLVKPEDWIKDNQEKVHILGQYTRDYKLNKKIKETIVFYEEKNE